MPPLDRVLREMQVNDPRQTALRQMGALAQLVEIIKAMSGPREFTKLTSDENRLIQTYNTAWTRVARSADSAFPGPYGNWKKFSLNTPYAYWRADSRFGVEGIDTFARFFSPAFRSQFNQAIGADQARHEAFVKAHPDEAGGTTADNPQSFSDAVSALVQTFGSTAKALGLDVGPPQGLRMSGTHTNSSGLQLTFRLSDASIFCGGALNQSAPYTVELKNNQVLITFPAEHPIWLTLQPNGTLVAPGASVVMNRGSDNTTQTCPIGVLTPPGTASTGIPTASQPAAIGTGAVLSIAAGVAQSGGVLPVSGRNFLLLNDNLETILRQTGFQAAPGMSTLRTIALCMATDANCQKGLTGMKAHAVAVAKTDLNGKGTFPAVPAGTYYLVGAGAANNQPVLWNLKVALKPGGSSALLDQRSAVSSL